MAGDWGGKMADAPLLPWGQPQGRLPRSHAQAGRKWRTIGENKAGGPGLAVLVVLLSTSLHCHVFPRWPLLVAVGSGHPSFPGGLAPHATPQRPCVGGAGGHLVSPGAGFPIEKHSSHGFTTGLPRPVALRPRFRRRGSIWCACCL